MEEKLLPEFHDGPLPTEGKKWNPDIEKLQELSESMRAMTCPYCHEMNSIELEGLNLRQCFECKMIFNPTPQGDYAKDIQKKL